MGVEINCVIFQTVCYLLRDFGMVIFTAHVLLSPTD